MLHLVAQADSGEHNGKRSSRAAPPRALSFIARSRCFAAALALSLGDLAPVLEAKLTQILARDSTVGEVAGDKLVIAMGLGDVDGAQPASEVTPRPR